MTLKDAADLATALTLIVATITFVLAVVEHRQRERDRRVQNWQKVVVYKIIQDGTTDFDEIKLRYVAEAQQLLDFELAKEAIQDSALQLALISLISDHLISRSLETGGYVLNVVSTQENEIKNLAMMQIQKKMAENHLISKLYETLEVDSGKYTIDQLFRNSEAEKLGYKFEDFDILVRDQIARGGIVINAQNQKLWLRAKLPTPQPAKALQPPNA
jgi:hypothetical protein